MPELGRAALVVCLGLVVYAVVAGGIAAHLRRARLAASARNALVAAFASAVVAGGVLLAALLRHDFSFQYVAAHTSRKLPTLYTLSAFWGGQECVLRREREAPAPRVRTPEAGDDRVQG